ncbi:MAG: polyhydroxyalkanoic acid system family protein [Sphingobium sp.]
MSEPLLVRIPHSLGSEEARRRMVASVDKLASYIPGGTAKVEHGWPSPNRMGLDITAMGQSISSTIDVEDTSLVVSVILPGLLALMAKPISEAIARGGGKLLEDKTGRPD